VRLNSHKAAQAADAPCHLQGLVCRGVSEGWHEHVCPACQPAQHASTDTPCCVQPMSLCCPGMCSWLAHEAFPAALQVAEAIKRDGGDAAALAGDGTADDFPKRCIGAAMDKWGTVDILVNNAGTHAAAASHAAVHLVPARAVTTASRSSRSSAIRSRAFLCGRCMAMQKP